MAENTGISLVKWISMIICTVLLLVYLWLVLWVLYWNIYMFDWLTFSWLMENLEWVVSGLIISLIVLLLFPLIITIEFRKLSKKGDS